MSGGPIIPESPASTPSVEPAPAVAPLPAESQSILHPVNVQPIAEANANANEQAKIDQLSTELQGHAEASNINGGVKAVETVEAEIATKKTGIMDTIKGIFGGKKAEVPQMVPGALWEGQGKQEPLPAVEFNTAPPALVAAAEPGQVADVAAEPEPIVADVAAPAVAEKPPVEAAPIVEPVVAEKPAESAPAVGPVQTGGVLDQAEAVVNTADVDNRLGNPDPLAQAADTAREDQAIAAAAELGNVQPASNQAPGAIAEADAQINTEQPKAAEEVHPVHQIINNMEQANQDHAQRQAEHLQQLREAVGVTTPATSTPAPVGSVV